MKINIQSNEMKRATGIFDTELDARDYINILSQRIPHCFIQASDRIMIGNRKRGNTPRQRVIDKRRRGKYAV